VSTILAYFGNKNSRKFFFIFSKAKKMSATDQEISQLAHFSNQTMTDQQILDKAKEIKQKQFDQERNLAQQKSDIIKKSWYTSTMNDLKAQLNAVSNKTLDLQEVTQKFELEKSVEKQKLQKAIEELGKYEGQCLHLGGTRQSGWITDRYDSHGYTLTLCAQCGKTME
jgi:lipopolysaccharide export LptBFGC system permease protein LptF